jgi:hypothetical protein
MRLLTTWGPSRIQSLKTLKKKPLEVGPHEREEGLLQWWPTIAMQNKIHWSSYPFASERARAMLLWILTESMCAAMIYAQFFNLITLTIILLVFDTRVAQWMIT